MAELLTLGDVQVFTGYSHLGGCREFVWEGGDQAEGQGRPARFWLRGLRCVEDLEALMLRTDLYLHTADGREYLLAHFQITDITDIENIRGVASSCRLLMEEFPEIKGLKAGENVVISKATHLQAFRTVSALVSSAHAKTHVDPRATNELVNELVGEIIKAPDAVLNLLAIKHIDDYTFSHNINVATLSMVIGQALGLTRDLLHDLGSGAILHDLGLLRVPGRILHKEGKLTPEEFTEVTRHPRLGLDLIGSSRDLSPRAREVILQHHERFAGKGYPHGQSGQNIPLLARICAVADAFDALTSDRPFRPALTPYQAMRTMLGMAGTHFDPEILQAFLHKLSVYPPGTTVTLNDGTAAVVLRGNAGLLLRPVVRRLQPAAGQPEVVDLARAPALFITGLAGPATPEPAPAAEPAPVTVSRPATPARPPEKGKTPTVRGNPVAAPPRPAPAPTSFPPGHRPGTRTPGLPGATPAPRQPAPAAKPGGQGPQTPTPGGKKQT
ncbi:MAG: HD-GYP domain-containing protein [Candidatus Riflebacteria bacterium]|nr:HD-GYP domain-containing protein [Candidatus Riflebacteria bacterium]